MKKMMMLLTTTLLLVSNSAHAVLNDDCSETMALKIINAHIAAQNKIGDQLVTLARAEATTFDPNYKLNLMIVRRELEDTQASREQGFLAYIDSCDRMEADLNEGLAKALTPFIKAIKSELEKK